MKKRRRPAESWRYILQADRQLPAEEQSVFVLRPLTVTERAAVLDSLSRVSEQPDGSRVTLSRVRTQAVELCLTHITAADQFPADEPAPWPATREARLAYLEQLTDDEVLELGDEIWAKSTLQPEDPAKN